MGLTMRLCWLVLAVAQPNLAVGETGDLLALRQERCSSRKALARLYGWSSAAARW